MAHRKKMHRVTQLCRKLKEEGGCPRSKDSCWFSHEEEASHSYQDFQKDPQKKERPLYADMASKSIQQPQVTNTVLEIMQSIKNQNTLMMELMKKINMR